MTQSLRIATLDDYKKSLSQKDAILEQNIYTDALSEYLKLGGAPMDAVNFLSESYIGIPSMCNATAKSVDSIGLDSNDILKKAIRHKLKDKFDPQRCDQVFIGSEMTPGWLDAIIEDPHWRQTMYELLEKYPNCGFLNFAALRIAEAGHEKEISKLRTASTYVKVYNLILGDAFAELLAKDNLEFTEDLPNLVRVCCEREDTYLYAQILIKRLLDEYKAVPFIRLKSALEKAAKDRGNQVFVDLLRSNLSSAPVELSRTIRSVMNSNNITPGDLIQLKQLYTSEKPPSSSHIRDYDLIVKMLKSLYVPHHDSVLKPELVEGVTFIIAYGTTMNDSKPRIEQKDEIAKVQAVLRDLYHALANKTEVGSVTGAMKFIISAIRYPVGSMAISLWIEYMAIHTTYFETYFRTKETPVLLLVLDEIASRHQLQQRVVFDVVKKCIRHKTEIFAPEIQLSLQRTWVDRMLYLVQLNYTLPVLKYFSGPGRDLDDSLLVYFIKKILKMAKSPYSSTFVHCIVDIVEPLVDNLAMIKDVKELVIDFLDEALLSNQNEQSDVLKLKIQSIIAQCK